MTKKQLTIEEAYKAMYLYLENYYELTKSDEIGGLLGGMSLLADGSTADEACWEDWIDAIKKLDSDTDINLSLK